VSHTNTRQRTKVRERRSANERTILDALEAALVEQPFGDVTVEDVMSHTRLGRTAFYRYFPDLESALLRRVAEMNDNFVDAAQRWLSADADPETGLFDAAIELASLYRDHADLLRGFAEAAVTATEIDNSWVALIEGFVARAAERIEALRAEGISSVTQPDETARALVWMTERYYQETYGRRRDVPLRLAAETIAQVWHRTLFDRAASARISQV
jgi:TetR/AcrR family transcriptional regulator, ethionamide resistance regulator